LILARRQKPQWTNEVYLIQPKKGGM